MEKMRKQLWKFKQDSKAINTINTILNTDPVRCIKITTAGTVIKLGLQVSDIMITLNAQTKKYFMPVISSNITYH